MLTVTKQTAGMVLGVLLAAGASGQDGALGPEQLFERVAPSVWTVRTFDADNMPLATGSAVVIAAGSLVTNCHVIAKAKRVAIFRENVSYGAVLEHPDVERDLCTLKVRNFTAPAVAVADAEAMKVGARVYAIGSPRGLEQTISDGLLSGVRRSADGAIAALQITVPISPGSSGGGLFDARGRLVGITTFQFRDSQNLNFAVPATWIAQAPDRARAALAAYRPGPAIEPAPTGDALVGKVYAYRLTDRLTHRTQEVLYQVDRVDGDQVVFNGGSRVEKRSGQLVSITAALGGEADLATPPAGWLQEGATVGSRWKLDYRSAPQLRPVLMDLDAWVTGEEVRNVGDRAIQTLRIDFTGYTDRNPDKRGASNGRYSATAWYAPALGRLVRFEVKARGGTTGGQFIIDEVLELVSVR